MPTESNGPARKEDPDLAGGPPAPPRANRLLATIGTAEAGETVPAPVRLARFTCELYSGYPSGDTDGQATPTPAATLTCEVSTGYPSGDTDGRVTFTITTSGTSFIVPVATAANDPQTGYPSGDTDATTADDPQTGYPSGDTDATDPTRHSFTICFPAGNGRPYRSVALKQGPAQNADAEGAQSSTAPPSATNR